LEKRGWGRFYYKNKSFNISVLLIYKIPLYPPFSKGEVKKRILSQSLKPHFQDVEVISCIFLPDYVRVSANV